MIRKTSMYSVAAGICFLILAAGPRINDSEKRNPVYPGKAWEKRSPESLGLNMEALVNITALMEKARSNGVLIKDGYLVEEWSFDGPSEKRIEVQSVSKSITGLVLGVALKDGTIRSIDDPVKQYYPAFDGGDYADQISFRHLITATSGLPSVLNKERYLNPGNTPPGEGSHYNNDHTERLAKALTYLYGESLLNVLRREVLNKIGAELEWGTHGSVIAANGKTVPVVAGYAYCHWTASDLARVGWLYLNNGKWENEQLIPVQFVTQTLTPLSVPVYNFRSTEDNEVMSDKMTYGQAWWGSYTTSGKLIWYMSGNGGQFCIIIPEAGLVFTKINGIGKEYQPFVGYSDFEKDLITLAKLL